MTAPLDICVTSLNLNVTLCDYMEGYRYACRRGVYRYCGLMLNVNAPDPAASIV